MRSLELELENFTSFRSRQTLNFSELDLFAITGPTGAGKTSLLDAITFALYGNVARFGKDAKASQIVSQGKDNLKVGFRFEVRGVKYRVTRTWRKRTKTEKYDVVLEKLNNDKWEKLETKEKAVTKRVEEIVGMDFEKFTRVILLPQGKFDEFIKGRKDKRREILRDLAGFEVFESMRKRASEQAKIFKSKYEVLEHQQNDLQLPSEYEITEKQQELVIIQEQIPKLNEEVLKAQKKLDEAEELLNKMKRLSQLQDDLSKLAAKGVEIENLTLQLQQAQAADQIKDNYALMKTARDKDKKAQVAVLSVKNNLYQAKQELEKQQRNLNEVKNYQQEIAPQIKKREEALNSAKNYEQQRQQCQTELEGVKQKQLQRKKYLVEQNKLLENTEIKLQDAKKQAEKVEAEIKQYSPGGKRLKQLQQVSPLLSNWKLIHEQTLKSREKLEKIALEKQKSQRDYHEATANLQKVQSSIQETQRLLQEAESTNNLVTQNNHVATLRSSLHDGDNCPVCNGTYKVSQLLQLSEVELVDITELSAKKEVEEKQQTIAERAFTKAESNLENSQNNELESQKELEENQIKLAELGQQINTLLQTETWKVDELNQELNLLKENDTKYNEALIKQKDVAASVIQIEQALESANNQNATALSEYETATQEVESRQKQLQEVEIKLHELTDGKTYTELQTELEKDNQKLEKQLQEATKSYQTAEKKSIQYEAQEQEISKSAEEAHNQKSELEKKWQAALISAGFTEESFLKAQTDSKQQTHWQKQITDYNTNKVKLETQVEEAKSQIENRTIDESNINSLRNVRINIEKQLKEGQDKLANLKAWMKELESKQKQVEKLKVELSKVKEQADTYSILSQNLKTNEFQAYILEHLETELVTRATNVLKDLTDSRYVLTIQDGDYYIEDNWNGGESRKVQTLSGGETFATSLSMALALSEKLSMGAELGSLFLDEGFGTLDAETLETVHQILESLRQQDRLIGVITHVKALGERLPQVKVRKSPEGSKLEVEVV